jgi:DegV family protein with EDD domain
LNKIALITDSGCDLSKEQIEKNNINVLPLRIIYKDREYIDRVNITPDEVYDNLSVEVPTTSLPSMEEIDNLFIKLKNDGYTHIIAVLISSGLSGTFNSVRLVSENHPEIKSHIFDSLSLSLGTGAIVLECAKMIAAGTEYDDILKVLPSFRSRIKVYYVLETIQYLIKGGRIGKVSGTIGEFLNLKPIISVNEEGIYFTHSKVRGRKQSISKIVDIAKETLVNEKAKVWVLHGGAREEGEELFKTISMLPNIVEISFGNISPALGVHTGPGLLGLIVMKEK